MFYSHFGILILENCNRHRHRFYWKSVTDWRVLSYRLKDAQLPTEGCSVTDWFQRQCAQPINPINKLFSVYLASL